MKILKLEKYIEPEKHVITTSNGKIVTIAIDPTTNLIVRPKVSRKDQMDIIFGSTRFQMDILNKMKTTLSPEEFEQAFFDAIEYTANCIQSLTN